jgi:uncharacterized protein
MSLTEHYKENLLALAKASIEHGIKTGSPLQVNLDDYPAELKEKRATFVTLKIKQQLRGCIGMLEAVRPLVEDIAMNAYAAAFKDPRFPPLQEHELENLDIHLSILSPAEPIAFSSETELIEKIRPGIDGLILELDQRRGTFLPSVWESIPAASQFLAQLKLKAGLPADFWSEKIKVYRYTTESIG